MLENKISSHFHSYFPMRMFLASIILGVITFTILIKDVSVQDFSNTEGSEETLVLVHCLFRHGDRTTSKKELYPNDPHINETFLPYGYGQLTKEGKLHEYAVGKELRERYDSFLGSYYNIDFLEAKTSDYNRTKMSLQMVLASLYPIEKSNAWMNESLWQPIPYNYEKATEDYMFLGSENCKIFRKYYIAAWSTPEVQQLVEACQNFYDYLEENTGWSFTDKGKAWTLYFCLQTEDEFGLELPDWTTEVYPSSLEYFAIYQYYVMMSTVPLRRIFSGYLFEYIIDETFSKINNGYNNQRKMYLYSGHEINLASVLLSLDLFYSHIPPYGAYIILEVHKIQEDYGIKVLYQDYTNSTANILRIPECSLATICPLERFNNIVKKYFIDLDNPDHC